MIGRRVYCKPEAAQRFTPLLGHQAGINGEIPDGSDLHAYF